MVSYRTSTAECHHDSVSEFQCQKKADTALVCKADGAGMLRYVLCMRPTGLTATASVVSTELWVEDRWLALLIRRIDYVRGSVMQAIP